MAFLFSVSSRVSGIVFIWVVLVFVDFFGISGSFFFLFFFLGFFFPWPFFYCVLRRPLRLRWPLWPFWPFWSFWPFWPVWPCRPSSPRASAKRTPHKGGISAGGRRARTGDRFMHARDAHTAVSYTHPTPPTNLRVELSDDPACLVKITNKCSSKHIRNNSKLKYTT